MHIYLHSTVGAIDDCRAARAALIIQRTVKNSPTMGQNAISGIPLPPSAYYFSLWRSRCQTSVRCAIFWNTLDGWCPWKWMRMRVEAFPNCSWSPDPVLVRKTASHKLHSCWLEVHRDILAGEAPVVYTRGVLGPRKLCGCQDSPCKRADPAQDSAVRCGVSNRLYLLYRNCWSCKTNRICVIAWTHVCKIQGNHHKILKLGK